MKIRDKKGVALLWAMITAAVILLIASIVATAVIKESHMTVDIENSAIAYAAATSGIEWGKWYIDENCVVGTNCQIPTVPSPFPLDLGVNADNTKRGTAKIWISKTDDDTFKIESLGKDPGGSISRRLEYEYKGEGFVQMDNDTFVGGGNLLPNIPNITGSFSFMFDIWRDTNATNSGPVRIGLSNESGSNAIYAVIDATSSPSQIWLEKRIGATTVASEKIGMGINNDTPFVFTNKYAARIRIDYIKDTAIQLTFMEKDSGSGELADCTQRISMDANGAGFGTFTKVYSSLAPILVHLDEIGDTNYKVVQLGLVSYFGYLDNLYIKTE